MKYWQVITNKKDKRYILTPIYNLLVYDIDAINAMREFYNFALNKYNNSDDILFVTNVKENPFCIIANNGNCHACLWQQYYRKYKSEFYTYIVMVCIRWKLYHKYQFPIATIKLNNEGINLAKQCLQMLDKMENLCNCKLSCNKNI